MKPKDNLAVTLNQVRHKMNTWFIILCWLCVLHLCYEFIVLPTMHLRNRYKLFALRDRLRDYEIKNGQKLNKGLIRYMYGSINVAIQTLDFFDMALLFKSERIISKDEEVRSRVEKNSAMFDKYATDELRKIKREMFGILFITVCLNGFMLSLYFLPITLLVHCGIFLKDRFSKAIDDFTDMPESVSSKLLPARATIC